MPRPVTLPELAVDAQVVLRDTRRAMAPLYEAALRSGNLAAISEASTSRTASGSPSARLSASPASPTAS